MAENQQEIVPFPPAHPTQTSETAATAVAAHARASVEARFVIAIGRPRHMETVRQELLRECGRSSFAEVARYRKPIGKGIEGLSIRFVEQAMTCLGNCDSEAVTIYDDDEKRIVSVSVTDFERNVRHSKQLTISKTVERATLRKGQAPIAQRTNSSGQVTYVVRATDDDLLNKEAALVSKAIRTCGLRVIPGWLQDEAERAILQTIRERAEKDPDGERKRLADAFGELGIEPRDLEQYLGHPLRQISPAQVADLRSIYAAIRDGQTTWAATLEHRDESEDTADRASAPPQSGAQGDDEKLAGDLVSLDEFLNAGAMTEARAVLKRLEGRVSADEYLTLRVKYNEASKRGPG